MWTFVLTDLAGTVHGELTQADARKVVDPWMRVPTASCTIPLWHPLSDLLMTTECMLKCYRTDPTLGTRVLAFVGPVLTTEEIGTNNAQSIAISAVGPMFRLQNRLLEVTKAGIEYGTEAAKIDLSLIGKQIVDTANGRGDTGISTNTGQGAQFTNTGQTAATGLLRLKPAAEALAEIAGGLNSFEWRVRPIEPVPNGITPRIGLFDVAPEATFKTLRPDAIYEYGTPRANVTGYTRKLSRETMMNRAYISVSGWPDTPAVNSAGTAQDMRMRQSVPAQTLRGLYEGLVPDGGVIAHDLRDKIAQFHVDIRSNPRQQITFTPAPDARPVPYIDYQVGEQIRARAVVRGVTRFDAMFRVWGISFDIDKQGVETVDVELIEP